MAMVGIVLLLVAVAVPLAVLWNILHCAWVEDKVPADAILVLGASVWPDERPSPILLSRIQTGVALYKQGYAPRIIVSGGLGQLPPSEAEAMRRVAVGMGVSPEDILMEDRSHSTLDNIRNSRDIMAAHGWRSVLLVSDPYHMFRACRIAADEGLEAHPVPVMDSPGWTILHLRAYYTIRETFAVIAYETLRVGRWLVDRLF
ncbi:MAG: YdcF family protein [Anaerolineales bacterium]